MFLSKDNTKSYADKVKNQKPSAVAAVAGSPQYASIQGTVSFYPVMRGVIICAEVSGLPTGSGPCGASVFGFHIHEGKSCTGNASDPFADTGGHYNPNNCPHPITRGICRRCLGTTAMHGAVS